MSKLKELFQDQNIVNKITNKLPLLFQMAEIESARANKIGMEVGSLRERILVALLIYRFGRENVKTEIPITESQIDVIVFDEPVSIKTISGDGRVKVVWTVDHESALRFIENYKPECDILLAQIKWDTSVVKDALPGTRFHPGGLFLIPLESQKELFDCMGRNNYLKSPKTGTNPRGVEFSKEAMIQLLQHEKTLSIPIIWKKTKIEYNPYKKWVEYWSSD